ncbi:MULTISPECIES: hypothetical protein [Streptomyces]|nr:MULTISPECIES: hypothetical protein [Streptomyces]
MVSGHILEWLTQNGAVFTALEVDAERIAHGCSASVSSPSCA